MPSSAKIIDERAADLQSSDNSLIIDLVDGRTISVPLAWYPSLHAATTEQRALGNRWRRLWYPLARY